MRLQVQAAAGSRFGKDLFRRAGDRALWALSCSVAPPVRTLRTVPSVWARDTVSPARLNKNKNVWALHARDTPDSGARLQSARQTRQRPRTKTPGLTDAGGKNAALTFRRGLVSLRAQRRPIKRLRFWIGWRSGVLGLGALCSLREFSRSTARVQVDFAYHCSAWGTWSLMSLEETRPRLRTCVHHSRRV